MSEKFETRGEIGHSLAGLRDQLAFQSKVLGAAVIMAVVPSPSLPMAAVTSPSMFSAEVLAAAVPRVLRFIIALRVATISVARVAGAAGIPWVAAV